MTELSIFTKQMQAMLPQWMKMAKDPTSTGAQFLNVFGVEFEHVQAYLDEVSNSQFIGTANLGLIDLIYKIPLVAPVEILDLSVYKIIGYKGEYGYNVQMIDTLQNFYSASPEAHVAIIDREEAVLYVRPAIALIDADKKMPYDSVVINDATHYDMIQHHVWNAFDEFGLLLGLYRLNGERNKEFKARILDVFANPANSTKDGLINAISRELGVDKNEITINELSDVAFKDSLLNDDGSPTQKLISYAQKTNKTLGFTWNNMSWDEAYWRSIEEANIGLEYLPHVWDVTLNAWSDDFIQAGIGDGNDLLVRAPEKQDNVRNFKYTVGVRGTIKDGGLVYPEHSFKYKITATGKILNQESKPETYKYTVIASEIIYLYFVVRAFQQYDYLTTIDFSTLTGFRYDSGNNLEVVTGQAMNGPDTDPVLELQAFMETSVKTATPVLQMLRVFWMDTTGTEREFLLDTQVDFDRNDPTVVTEKLNVLSTPAGSVELGYGDFYHVINSQGDWKKGTMNNSEIIPDGSIRLVRPKI